MKIIYVLATAVVFFFGASTGYFFNLHTSRLYSLKEFAENTVEKRETDIKTFATLLVASETVDYETFIDSANRQNINHRSEDHNGFSYVYLRGLIIKFSPEGMLAEVMINSL